MDEAGFDLIRYFGWLALTAFLAGFLGYLAVAQPAPASAEARPQPTAAASGPASDDWNTPKRI